MAGTSGTPGPLPPPRHPLLPPTKRASVAHNKTWKPDRTFGFTLLQTQ